MRLESSQGSRHVDLSVTTSGMTGGAPASPLATYQGVVHIGVFRLCKSCESHNSLNVVGADFARSKTLFYRIQSVDTIKTMSHDL